MCRALILVPTDGELRTITDRLNITRPGHVELRLCGFGAIAAAARTSQILSKHTPQLVILAGIAGGFDEDSELGSALSFSSVRCHGIGVGESTDYQSAETLGWAHYDGETDSPILDCVQLAPTRSPNLKRSGQLLSVCAASSNATEAEHRRRLYPQASAEDMEGFAVAVACRMHGVPLTIVRGISNFVGDRDKSRWQVQQALEAVANAVSNEINVRIDREEQS